MAWRAINCVEPYRIRVSGRARIAGAWRLLPGAFLLAAGRVGNVDNVDYLILSAGLIAGGRGGHAIVDNVG